jgi:hypothetical protein
MITIENIHKLNGKEIGDWRCYHASEQSDYYVINFELIGRIMIVEFRLYKEAESKGVWELKATFQHRGVLAGPYHSNSNVYFQSVTKDDLITSDRFCEALGRSLSKFDRMLQMGIPTYNTSSLSTVTRRINGGGHSFGGYQIPKPPPISTLHTPQWYVPKEELKNPTMWEIFKEMVKWDSWINILFPMKSAMEQVIPKKKKITAKKAAY